MATTDQQHASGYHPEPYWSEVARRIGERRDGSVIAGDDEPYYRYKRRKFLRMLHRIGFNGKSVLEVGCGPGGNLLEVLQDQPASLTGADISADMIALAKANTSGKAVDLVKVDGTHLPFADGQFDVVFTATVLQHNTDDAMLEQLLSEICRVSGREVVLLERIEKTETGDQLCIGRSVDRYRSLCAAQGFDLRSVEFINTRISYFVSGAIRKIFNRSSRREGERITAIAALLQQATLAATRLLDRIFPSATDVARLTFAKRSDAAV